MAKRLKSCSSRALACRDGSSGIVFSSSASCECPLSTKDTFSRSSLAVLVSDGMPMIRKKATATPNTKRGEDLDRAWRPHRLAAGSEAIVRAQATSVI